MRCCLRLIISFRIIGFAEKIIDADVIEAGEFDENLGWDIICADFIFGISGLRHP